MTNIGTCALCFETGELKESHIIPAFVWRWMKESSVTGYFRHGEKPNLRQQDGYKIFLLCVECEQKLSRWENKFLKYVFSPLNNGIELERYGPWLLKFSVSVSWRVLLLFKQELDLYHFPEKLRSAADVAIETWRQFLLDERPHPDKFEQHMLPWPGLIGSHHDPEMPDNINRYILRSVDIDAACSQDEAFVYVKMGNVFLIGFITMMHPNQWRDTKVHVQSGLLHKKHWRLPAAFRNFVYYKARRAKKSQEKISEHQRDRIDSDYRKKMDQFADSVMFKAMTQDSILYGESSVDE